MTKGQEWFGLAGLAVILVLVALCNCATAGDQCDAGVSCQNGVTSFDREWLPDIKLECVDWDEYTYWDGQKLNTICYCYKYIEAKQ